MQNRYPETIPDADPVSAEDQLNIRIAWYYYVNNMTQQQIADRLGITRVRVNKALATCRETGVVQIRINSPLASCIELEDRLQAHFGLERVTVVPSPDDPSTIFRVLGVGVAPSIEEYLQDGCTIAVGWGRTLRQAVRELQGRPLPNMKVVSLLGGLHYGSANNTVEIASSLATLFGGSYYYLAAPLFAPSEAYRGMILEEASVQDVLGKARNADVALLTVGDLSERSLMLELGLVNPQDARSLRAAGAVGDLLGHWLDRDGIEVNHPLNRRAISLDPEDLRKIKKVVLVSGGPYKAQIIRAVLLRNVVHELVIDESAALELLGGASESHDN
ncbi:sugar-binding transcriptional regulator [Pseudomonas sp. GD03842]|uniref:sugar-binding transcriptional regulator n=1 Tax=Pseudomonas sp. GD03842 TaxID=2975385 RepID=UPI0024472CB4|nr:sugar-binding transcriptional regulator [Pseudomonas sp. GD03842]MDH0747128.1 sugar-binding transcriptional regulator [Pseudomonas sp. GD03842]